MNEKMNEKKHIVLILIALAAIIGVVTLFLTKNSPKDFSQNNGTKPVETGEVAPIDTAYKELTFPDNTLDTSDWETYHNEEFGFEVRYPKNVVVVSDKRAAEMKEMYEFGFYLNWHLGRVDIELLSEKIGLHIYVYDKDVDTVFKIYSKSHKAPYDVIGNIPMNNTQLFFLTPRQDTQAWDLSRYQSVYFAGDTERAYEIVLAEIPSEQKEIFQKILSTFKLLK